MVAVVVTKMQLLEVEFRDRDWLRGGLIRRLILIWNCKFEWSNTGLGHFSSLAPRGVGREKGTFSFRTNVGRR